MLKSVIDIAQKAGEVILEHYNERAIEVKLKADDSPLTKADLAAHTLISDTLTELYPDIPIISEEAALLPFSTRTRWDRYWLIDPLDGTKEFIDKNGEFTVNIALIQDNNPVLGVVYAPAKQLLYYAQKGHGAFSLVGNSLEQAITVSHDSHKKLRVVSSRRHGNNEQLKQFLSKQGDYQIIQIGSSLKICKIADGTADVYPRFGPTSEWDIAAAHCVLNEAGGRLFAATGESLRYNQKESLLNPSFLAVGRGFEREDYTNLVE